MILILFNLLKLFWVNSDEFLISVSNECVFCSCWMESLYYKCQVDPIVWWCDASVCFLTLLFFCLVVLPITENGILKYPQINVDLSISFIAISICFIVLKLYLVYTYLWLLYILMYFFYHYVVSLSILSNFLCLKSILCNINIAISFSLMFEWYIFFFPSSLYFQHAYVFKFEVSSYREWRVRSCFYPLYESLPCTGLFIPFTYNYWYVEDLTWHFFMFYVWPCTSHCIGSFSWSLCRLLEHFLEFYFD